MPIIIPPGKTERTLRTAAYTVVGFVGLWGIAITLLPTDLQAFGALGRVLELIWCILVATALPAAGAAAVGLYRIEMTLLPLFTSALALAAGYDWFQLFHIGSPFILGRAAVVTALALELCTRWWTLYRLNRRGSQWTSFR